MFDLGFWELALIGIVALLVVGPDKLPAFARETGRWVRKLRRFSSDARREFQRELQWGDDEDPRRDIRKLRSELGEKMSDLDRLMQKAPDRQPGWQSEYTATGARKNPPAGGDDNPANGEKDDGDRNESGRKT